MVDPLVNQLVHAAIDLLIVDQCQTSGGGGLLCGHVRTARPCGVSITYAREVAPGLPQGGVDLRDGV